MNLIIATRRYDLPHPKAPCTKTILVSICLLSSDFYGDSLGLSRASSMPKMSKSSSMCASAFILSLSLIGFSAL